MKIVHISTNFEAYLWTISSSLNFLFMKRAYVATVFFGQNYFRVCYTNMETFYSFVQCRHLEIHQQTIKNQPSIIEFLVLNGKTVRREVM